MIQYIEITPTADEFNILTDSVGWGCDDRKIVEKALKNTVYSICAYDDNKIIGFGRLIGDTAMLICSGRYGFARISGETNRHKHYEISN